MKKRTALSLLSSISILTSTQSVGASDDALFSTHAGTGKTARVTPATLDELETFLRKNCGADFPEIGFSAFSTPFKPEFSKLARIDQIRARTAAIDTLGQMVAVAYYSFTQEIERLKVKILHFPDIAASRPETLAHYKRFNHRYFLKFQEIITQLLEFAQTKTGDLANDATAALTQPYGSSNTLKIAWLRDNTGIVPAPLQGALTKIIYSAPAPYGYWGDDYQRAMVLIDGALITAPGIYIDTKDGATFKLIRENGSKSSFITSPITMRTGADHPIVSTLLESGVFRAGPEPKNLSAFLTFPTNPTEDREFEAVFLEELMEDSARGETNLFGQHFLEAQMRAIENIGAATAAHETTATGAAATEADRAPSILPLQAYIDSLYEELVLSEQAEISRRVVEGSIEGKSKASKKKSKAAPLKTMLAAAATSEASEKEAKSALRQKILSTLKERGRIKWRTLARAIITALKDAYSKDALTINVTEKGSHFMLHIAGETSSDGATIIRPHGKADRTVSAGEARGLAENLIELIFKLTVNRPVSK